MELPKKEPPIKNFLENCLFFNTNAFSRQLLRLAEAEFKHLKISPAHASLLMLVYDTPGISPKELSRLLQLTPSTITRFIDSLAKKKMVLRRNKGKTVSIFPTQRSLDMKASIAQAYKRLYLNYTKILGVETAMLLSHQIARSTKQVMESLQNHEKVL